MTAAPAIAPLKPQPRKTPTYWLSLYTEDDVGGITYLFGFTPVSPTDIEVTFNFPQAYTKSTLSLQDARALYLSLLRDGATRYIPPNPARPNLYIAL